MSQIRFLCMAKIFENSNVAFLSWKYPTLWDNKFSVSNFHKTEKQIIKVFALHDMCRYAVYFLFEAFQHRLASSIPAGQQSQVILLKSCTLAIQMKLDECHITTSNLTTLQLSKNGLNEDRWNLKLVSYFCLFVRWYYTKHSSKHKVLVFAEQLSIASLYWGFTSFNKSSHLYSSWILSASGLYGPL